MNTTADLATPAWSTAAIVHLQDATSCPVCGERLVTPGRCDSCGTDLTTPDASRLWNASQAAAAALNVRESLRQGISRTASAPLTASVEPRTAVPPAAPVVPARADSAPTGSTTVQSVLAVAGAGLFAVAAIVFTFFNPDLADHGLRGIATLVATVVLVVSARQLARRRLTSSAEAVAALALVFVALDVYAVAGFAPSPQTGWVLTAVGSLAAGSLMAVLALRWGVRAWLGAALVGVAVVPAMFGLAPGSALAALGGWLTTMAAAMALIAALRHLPRPPASEPPAESTERRRDSPTPPTEDFLRHPYVGEAVALSIAQFVALVAALPQLLFAQTGSAEGLLWTAFAAFSAIALIARGSARTMLAALWSLLSGGAVSAAGVALTFALALSLGVGQDAPAFWFPIFLLGGALSGFLVAALVHPPVSSHLAPWSSAGALVITGLTAIPVTAAAALGSLSNLTAAFRPSVPNGDLASVGATVALACGAAAFFFHAATVRRRGGTGVASAVVGVWASGAVVAAVTCLPYHSTWVNVAVGVTLSIVSAYVVRRRMPRARAALRWPLVVSAHVALILAAMLSWTATGLAVASSPAILVGAAAIALSVPRSVRWAHVGAGYAYALVALGAALVLAGLDEFPVLSLTTSAAALGAIVATYLPRVTARPWWAILAVTSVPFLLGVLQVVRERSGWTALSTGLIFLLALTLLTTRRPGLFPALRAFCAALLVPSLSVVIICLGAQVLSTSASPVTLPLIAVVVAVTLPVTGLIVDALVRRGMPVADAALVRRAIECSTLLTGALAVVVALTRDAAGLPTAVLVQLILAVGCGIAAGVAGRSYLWWFAAAACTGAMWGAWRLVAIDALEPYLLPPALAAVVVGAALEARGRDGRALATAGSAVAVMPSLVLFALAGEPWRLVGLLATAAALLIAGALPGAPRRLRVPFLVVSVAAAAVGPVQGVRLGVRLDDIAPGIPLLVVCFAVSAIGGALAGLAGRAVSRVAPASPLPRWILATAVFYVAAGTWAAIRPGWPEIWAMWALMSTLLGVVVVIAFRLRFDRGGPTGASGLPPVWFVFVVAFATGVVAWSPRELRVEMFSVPLGLALLIAGALHLRDGTRERGLRPTLSSWPANWRGSWPLLAPGIVTIMSASIISTFTDPLTWRAILVIVMALAAILIGARARLAAPFLIGIVVLPVENVSAFSVRIGRGIESMPWWITLAAVGTVLIIIAVSYERRAGDAEGFAARLRDLR